MYLNLFSLLIASAITTLCQAANSTATGQVVLKNYHLEFAPHGYYNPRDLPLIFSNITFEEYNKLLECADCQKRQLQNHQEIQHFSYHGDIHKHLVMKYAKSDLKKSENLPKEAETLALLQAINPNLQDQVAIQKNIDLVQEKLAKLPETLFFQKMNVIRSKLVTRSKIASTQQAVLIRKGEEWLSDGQKESLKQLKKCIKRTDKRIDDLENEPEWGKYLYRNYLSASSSFFKKSD